MKLVMYHRLWSNESHLTDIKIKEQSWENLARARDIFEPPRFMRVYEAAQQLIDILDIRSAEGATADSLGELLV